MSDNPLHPFATSTHIPVATGLPFHLSADAISIFRQQMDQNSTARIQIPQNPPERIPWDKAINDQLQSSRSLTLLNTSFTVKETHINQQLETNPTQESSSKDPQIPQSPPPSNQANIQSQPEASTPKRINKKQRKKEKKNNHRIEREISQGSLDTDKEADNRRQRELAEKRKEERLKKEEEERKKKEKTKEEKRKREEERRKKNLEIKRRKEEKLHEHDPSPEVLSESGDSNRDTSSVQEQEPNALSQTSRASTQTTSTIPPIPPNSVHFSPVFANKPKQTVPIPPPSISTTDQTSKNPQPQAERSPSSKRSVSSTPIQKDPKSSDVHSALPPLPPQPLSLPPSQTTPRPPSPATPLSTSQSSSNRRFSFSELDEMTKAFKAKQGRSMAQSDSATSLQNDQPLLSRSQSQQRHSRGNSVDSRSFLVSPRNTSPALLSRSGSLHSGSPTHSPSPYTPDPHFTVPLAFPFGAGPFEPLDVLPPQTSPPIFHPTHRRSSSTSSGQSPTCEPQVTPTLAQSPHPSTNTQTQTQKDTRNTSPDALTASSDSLKSRTSADTDKDESTKNEDTEAITKKATITSQSINARPFVPSFKAKATQLNEKAITFIPKDTHNTNGNNHSLNSKGISIPDFHSKTISPHLHPHSPHSPLTSQTDSLLPLSNARLPVQFSGFHYGPYRQTYVGSTPPSSPSINRRTPTPQLHTQQSDSLLPDPYIPLPPNVPPAPPLSINLQSSFQPHHAQSYSVSPDLLSKQYNNLRHHQPILIPTPPPLPGTQPGRSMGPLTISQHTTPSHAVFYPSHLSQTSNGLYTSTSFHQVPHRPIPDTLFSTNNWEPISSTVDIQALVNKLPKPKVTSSFLKDLTALSNAYASLSLFSSNLGSKGTEEPTSSKDNGETIVSGLLRRARFNPQHPHHPSLLFSPSFPLLLPKAQPSFSSLHSVPSVAHATPLYFINKYFLLYFLSLPDTFSLRLPPQLPRQIDAPHTPSPFSSITPSYSSMSSYNLYSSLIHTSSDAQLLNYPWLHHPAGCYAPLISERLSTAHSMQSSQTVPSPIFPDVAPYRIPPVSDYPSDLEDASTNQASNDRMLTEEILSHVSHLSLTKAECFLRFELIDHITKVVQKSCTTSSQPLLLYVYGSFSSYLSIPTSDIDIEILTLAQYRYIVRAQNYIRHMFEFWYGAAFTHNFPSLHESVSKWTGEGAHNSPDEFKRLLARVVSQGTDNPVDVCERCGSLNFSGFCDCSPFSLIDEGDTKGKDQRDDKRTLFASVPPSPAPPTPCASPSITSLMKLQAEQTLNSSLQTLLDFSYPLFPLNNPQLSDLQKYLSRPTSKLCLSPSETDGWLDIPAMANDMLPIPFVSETAFAPLGPLKSTPAGTPNKEKQLNLIAVSETAVDTPLSIRRSSSAPTLHGIAEANMKGGNSPTHDDFTEFTINSQAPAAESADPTHSSVLTPIVPSRTYPDIITPKHRHGGLIMMEDGQDSAEEMKLPVDANQPQEGLTVSISDSPFTFAHPSKKRPSSIKNVSFTMPDTPADLIPSSYDDTVNLFLKLPPKPASNSGETLEVLTQVQRCLEWTLDQHDSSTVTPSDATMSEINSRLSVNFISTAKVPIVKIHDEQTNLNVDVGYGSVTGITNSDYLRCLLVVYPTARPLILIVKAFLAAEGLNEPFKGGLGGYALSLLVVSHLQQFKRNFGKDWKTTSLGCLLTCFFQLYGESPTLPQPPNSNQRFSFSRYAVSVRGEGRYILLETLKHSNRNLAMATNFTYSNIVVEDPLDPENNTARSCYQISLIQRNFCRAFGILSSPTTPPPSAKQIRQHDIALVMRNEYERYAQHETVESFVRTEYLKGRSEEQVKSDHLSMVKTLCTFVLPTIPPHTLAPLTQPDHPLTPFISTLAELSGQAPQAFLSSTPEDVEVPTKLGALLPTDPYFLTQRQTANKFIQRLFTFGNPLLQFAVKHDFD
ncbi:putative DNA polymerase sigma [Blattamonas nauphoetae]|uniref:DNA polymerase sigma n=1 Tax=Blattamonas nauphoetae TaxID=2049346 RepID=A0ABQ9YC27_9EUKA|nr:putative DNA polymerase sigma [Blattamonas nauphoetae]